MTLRILNDCHIGTIRATGTTPATQLALRQYLIDDFIRLLPSSDLMILGDLFDKDNIPISDFLAAYNALLDWCLAGHRLWLVAGNHDLSKTSSTLSSYDLLGRLLHTLYPNTVSVVKEACSTPYGYIIPHVANQDLFDIELGKVPPCDYLFLHCNYDNNFAATSDQSLNLSEQVRRTLPAKTIVVAHEHHTRQVHNVVLPGNQTASSCSDWLSNSDKVYAELFSDSKRDSYALRLESANRRSDQFRELDWRSLTDVDHKFIRITGKASPEEATSVVTSISKYRQASKALVISNAVDIQAADDSKSAIALEAVTTFDVWKSLEGVLNKREMEILRSVANA